MTSIAEKLYKDEWTLRSGHAQGADRAFELGAKEKSIIYLPWQTFGITKYNDDLGMKVLGTPVCNQDEWERNYKELIKLNIS
jgi:hypothetical protein